MTKKQLTEQLDAANKEISRLRMGFVLILENHALPKKHRQGTTTQTCKDALRITTNAEVDAVISIAAAARDNFGRVE